MRTPNGDSRPPYTFQLGPDQSPSERIAAAIAVLTNTPATELRPVLFDAIEPDALDALFAGKKSRQTENAHIEFAYADYRVQVQASGEVSITQRIM